VSDELNEIQQAAAILGAIEGDLSRSGYRHADQLSRLTETLLNRITALEDTATGLVDVLSVLSTKLRRAEAVLDPERPDDYYDGFRDASHAAAAQVAEVMTGPVMQAVLNQIDAEATVPGE
jgi:hypothetical protein